MGPNLLHMAKHMLDLNLQLCFLSEYLISRNSNKLCVELRKSLGQPLTVWVGTFVKTSQEIKLS